MVAAAHVRNLIVIAIGYMVGGAAYAKLPAPVDGFLPLPLARPAIAFLLPTAAAVTYALLRVISLRDPIRRGDSTVAITYDAILFRIVLFVIGLHAIVLAGLLGATALAASGVPMLLGLVLVGVGNLLPRTRPNVVIGIRTSRTLADPLVWMRMNRVAGYVAVGLGTVLAASAALLAPGPKVRDVVSAAALAGAALLVVCYWSYSRPAVKTAPDPHSRSLDFIDWGLRAAVALVFLYFGAIKFPSRPESPWPKLFAAIGLGQWFRYFTGALEVTCAILLLIPGAVPFA